MQRRGSICVVLLVSGIALGQAPVGPSTAVLNGSRFGLSAEYSRADVDVIYAGGAKESFDFQTAYANFAVGLTNRWDFFVRLGGSQAEDTGFDGDWYVSWGMGTRVTAFQWRDFGWGALAQFTTLLSRSDTAELNLVEYVIGTGPTWQHGPLSLYGGPLLRLADGKVLADVHSRWDAGGYIGGRVSLFQIDPSHTSGINRCDLVAEGRFTGDSTGFSVGVLLPFGGTD